MVRRRTGVGWLYTWRSPGRVIKRKIHLPLQPGHVYWQVCYLPGRRQFASLDCAPMPYQPSGEFTESEIVKTVVMVDSGGHFLRSFPFSPPALLPRDFDRDYDAPVSKTLIWPARVDLGGDDSLIVGLDSIPELALGVFVLPLKGTHGWYAEDGDMLGFASGYQDGRPAMAAVRADGHLVEYDLDNHREYDRLLVPHINLEKPEPRLPLAIGFRGPNIVAIGYQGRRARIYRIGRRGPIRRWFIIRDIDAHWKDEPYIWDAGIVYVRRTARRRFEVVTRRWPAQRSAAAAIAHHADRKTYFCKTAYTLIGTNVARSAALRIIPTSPAAVKEGLLSAFPHRRPIGRRRTLRKAEDAAQCSDKSGSRRTMLG